MKITIDTREDSHEDIRKAIKLLNHIVGETAFTNVEPPKEQVDTTNMMSMFADPQPKEKPDSPPDFSAFLNLANQKKEEEQKQQDEPRIQFF